MSAQLIAALNADLADQEQAWQAISAQESTHEHIIVPEPGEIDKTLERHATITIRSEPRGLTLVAMLEGPAGGPPTSGKIYHAGTALEFTDAGLIARLDAALPSVASNAEAHLLALLGAG